MKITICKICGEFFPSFGHNEKYCSPTCIKVAGNHYAIDYSKKYNKKQRAFVLNLLGNRCIKCGISDTRVLQIDHINGGGHKDVVSFSGYSIYYRHILEVKGIGYQLLCANCNWIKRYENQEFRVLEAENMNNKKENKNEY